MADIFLTILRKRWRFSRPRKIVHDGEECDGLCSNPKERSKKISVCRSLHGQKELSVILHELIHAADWKLDEDFVDELSIDLARALVRLGYSNDPFRNTQGLT